MNLSQVKLRNLKSFKLACIAAFILASVGCSDNKQVEDVFVPNTTVNPNISLDCSGIWEGSPLCLERNEALLELRKLDKDFKLNELAINKNPTLLDKIKSKRVEGDKFYNDEFYFKARDSYSDAVKLINELRQTNETKLNKYISDIKNLLAIGKIDEANDILAKGLTIDSLNEELLALNSRAENFIQINTLISEANKFLAEEDYENALAKINEAIKLDTFRNDSKNLKSKIIKESNQFYFDIYLRNAYKNLDADNIKRAIFNLEKAKKIFPNSNEIAVLERSLSTQKKDFDLKNFKLDAERFYKSENWDKSLESYKSALSIAPDDSELVDKVLKVETILKIYKDLKIYSKNPERLSSSNIRVNFKKVIDKANNLNLTNEVGLLALITQSEEIYNRFNKMVVLKLISNDKTYVDIQKTAQFQPFNTELIKLYPGKYVIVAKRKGMQSTRTEINISPEIDQLSVKAICDVSCMVYKSNDNDTKLDDSAVVNKNINNITTNETSELTNYIVGAKINMTTFSRNLVCNKPTNNKSFKLTFEVSVKSNGFVIATRIIDNSEAYLNNDDKVVIGIVERALKKSRFKLPKVDGSTSAGKVKYSLTVPNKFCQE